jgi:hypothetical protein
VHSKPLSIAIRSSSVLGTGLALWMLVWRPWMVNLSLPEIERRTRQAEVSTATQKVVIARANLEELEALPPAARRIVDFHVLTAVNRRFAGNRGGEIDAYDAALAIDQRPELYFDRGEAHLADGDIERAVADLAHAVRFNPNLLDRIDGELRERVARAAGQ